MITEGPGNHAIRTARWRYIRYSNGDEELYDHSKDPWEHTNLVDKPEYAEVLVQHRKHIPKKEAPGKGMSHLYRPVQPPGAGLPGSGFEPARTAGADKRKGKKAKAGNQ